MKNSLFNKMRKLTPNPASMPNRTLGPARNRLNRRSFLRGAGTAGLALPFLESIPERSAFAQDGSTPRFGLFIVTSCGVVGNRFWPGQTGGLTADGLAGDSSKAVSILAEHADRLLIVRGANLPSGAKGCAHADALAKSLTSGGTQGGGNTVTATSISADTAIANALGVTPLTLYAGLKEGYIDEKLSFSSPGQVRAAEGNPYNVYLDLAGLLSEPGGSKGGGSGGGNGGEPTNMADYLAQRRKSINDLVRGDLGQILGDSRISAADRRRLDAHLSNIRDLENNMMNMGDDMEDPMMDDPATPMAAMCSGANLDMDALELMRSGSAGNPYFEQNGTQEEVVKLHLELTALAFACNVTQVATLQAGDGTDATQYTVGGEKYERFHRISHRINSDGGSGSPIANAEGKHADIDRIRMETFKHGIDKWAMYDTPNGPLLDNGFMYWASHISDGPTHSFNNIPIIIAGNAGGYLKQGAYVDAGNASIGQVLNTLINANGVQSQGFGNANGQLNQMMAGG